MGHGEKSMSVTMCRRRSREKKTVIQLKQTNKSIEIVNSQESEKGKKKYGKITAGVWRRIELNVHKLLWHAGFQ